MKQERMKVGKITGAHGIQGELKVMPLTDDPGRFEEFEALCIDGKTYPVRNVRLHQGKVLLTLKGIKDRTAAEALRGHFIEIDRDEAQELEDDEFYIVDLIGSAVFTKDGRKIGKLLDVLQTSGPVDTAEISVVTPEFRPNEKEEKRKTRHLYLPFRQEFFLEIDLENGRIMVDFPEEYWEL